MLFNDERFTICGITCRMKWPLHGTCIFCHWHLACDEIERGVLKMNYWHSFYSLNWGSPQREFGQMRQAIEQAGNLMGTSSLVRSLFLEWLGLKSAFILFWLWVVALDKTRLDYFPICEFIFFLFKWNLNVGEQQTHQLMMKYRDQAPETLHWSFLVSIVASKYRIPRRI